jgi:hypothetical protein
MGPETRQVLKSLRDASEGQVIDGWRDVYLDNAKPSDMRAATFRSYLAKLSQHGYYRPVDGYAFGSVNMGEGIDQ